MSTMFDQVTANKACPVVIRECDSGINILAFQHPLAGKQLVKGTIETGETIAQSCERELFEEAGIAAKAELPLGILATGYNAQVWGFYLMRVDQTLPEHWTHHCLDDHGHDFSFFWHPLAGALSDEWHPLFKQAIQFLQHNLILKEAHARP